MRILILTQNDNLYLPAALGRVCEALQKEIVCLVAAPAMSTHGGALPGLARHLALFGVGGTAQLAGRVLRAKWRAFSGRPGARGPFHSLRAVARAFNIPYHQVRWVKDPSFLGLVDQYEPELLISMSCPQIIGKKIRDRFPKGCINVHGAPLPRYRGLMPAFWALRNGETATAATVHDLTAKLDDGAILVQREVAILPEDTWDSLVCKTKAVGAEALLEAVAQIRNGTERRRPNPEAEATYFSFPGADDRRAFLALGRRFF